MNVIWFDYALPCICSFLACLGFTLVFNIHGVGKLICGVGGALGWLVYLLAGKTIFAAFLASAVIGLYSEIMARLRRCPVTGYLLVALLPLVPGGGIYYAMSYCVEGDIQRFLDTLLHTFGMAAALAVGAMLTASLFRAAIPTCATPEDRAELAEGGIFSAILGQPNPIEVMGWIQSGQRRPSCPGLSR